MKWIRWIARGTGALVAGFWLIIGILLGVIESEPWTTESYIMATLVIASALSVLVAWWREGLGGIMVLACAIAHSTFAYIASGHNRAFAILISGGPFFVVGILFLLSWRRSRRTEETDLCGSTPRLDRHCREKACVRGVCETVEKGARQAPSL